jgi:hypothetical protein
MSGAMLDDEQGGSGMTRFAVILALLLVFFAGSAVAAGGPFGLGIIVGEPTGLSGKLFLSDANAIDGAVAWSFSGDNAFHIHGDYLYHNYTLLDVEKGKLPLYFGIGASFKFREDADDNLGVRIPVGLAYMFDGAPFDVFVEIVPVLELTPDTDFELEGAIGGRFFF